MKLAVALMVALMLGPVQAAEYTAQPRVVEKIEAQQLPELTEEEKERAEKMALNHPRVLEMIAGGSYGVRTGVWHNETLHKLGAVVIIEGEDKKIVVFVDLMREEVVKITQIGGPGHAGRGVNPLVPAAFIALLLSLYFLRRSR
ncbi:MAG: hypothetical protein GXO66_07615 [Euryarchaeota archaeon]|nr:hypothetical protein [Euryarchaeota archaeon]